MPVRHRGRDLDADLGKQLATQHRAADGHAGLLERIALGHLRAERLVQPVLLDLVRFVT